MIESDDIYTRDLFGSGQPHDVRSNMAMENELEDLRSLIADVICRSASSPVMKERAKELFVAAIREIDMIGEQHQDKTVF